MQRGSDGSADNGPIQRRSAEPTGSPAQKTQTNKEAPASGAAPDRAPGQPEGRLSARRGDDSVPARSPWAYPPRGPQSRVRAGAASPAVLGGPSSSQRLERAARVHRAPGELWGGSCGRGAPPDPGRAGGVLAAAASRQPGSFPGSGWCACLCACVCARARVGPDTHVPPTHACSDSLARAATEPWLPGCGARRPTPARWHRGSGSSAQSGSRRAGSGADAGLTLIAQLPPVRARVRPGFWFPGETPRGGAGAPAGARLADRVGIGTDFPEGPSPSQAGRDRAAGTEIRGAQLSPPAPASTSAGAGEGPPASSSNSRRRRAPGPRRRRTQWRRLGSPSLPEPRREPQPAAGPPAAPQPRLPARPAQLRPLPPPIAGGQRCAGRRGAGAGAPSPGPAGGAGPRGSAEVPASPRMALSPRDAALPPALRSLLGFPTALRCYAQQQASVFFFDIVFYVASLSGFLICDDAPFKIIFLMLQFHNHRCLGGETDSKTYGAMIFS